jgi:hypothetical protein
MRTGRPGRPRLRPWDDIYIAQVVKQYAQKRVVGVVRRIVQGSSQQVQTLLEQTQGGGQINVAYIERLNATFRSRIAALVRRGRALARQTHTLQQAMYLMGTVYNFCTYHKSLRVPIYLPGHRRRWIRRTPAIAAGITDHRWTVEELLSFRVPLPPWRPPKRRGRPAIGSTCCTTRCIDGMFSRWPISAAAPTAALRFRNPRRVISDHFGSLLMAPPNIVETIAMWSAPVQRSPRT